MSEELFNVVFRGDIVPGQVLPDVKLKFAQVFRLTPDKVDAYFSGKPVVLKKECDRATAEKFKAVLQQAGALVDIKSANAPAPAPRPAPVRPVAPVQSAASVQPAAAPAQPAVVNVAPAVAVADTDPESWTIGKQGADILRPEERVEPAPVQVSIDHIELKKRNPFSMDEEEPLEEARDLPPPELDLSLYQVAATGETLVEYQEFVPAEIDLGNLSLDQVGADVLRDDEREVVEPVVVDISSISLAPPGGELGELEKPVPPPPPSTDHLSIDK
jgi:hypothetical protein